MKAVIMAGGKGTRLSSLTNNEIPKPMVKVLDKPILEHQIETLKEYGIKDFILSVGHLSEKIIEYFGDGKRFGVTIEYIVENEPLGSGGALFFLKNKMTEDFLLLSGDMIFNIDIPRMLNFHKEKDAVVTLLAHPNTHPFDSDLVEYDEDFKVVNLNFKNSNRTVYKNTVNAGFFIINPIALNYFGESAVKLNLEHDFINSLIKEKKGVYAYISTEYIKDVGTVDRIEKATKDLLCGVVKNKNLKNKQKCVFLDRDGTINEYKGFIRNEDEISLLDGSAEAIKLLNESDYLAVVITNQPVVARGEVSYEKLDKIHAMIETLLGKSGAYIDGLFYCPHHPHKGFDGEIKELKIDCDCRKPKTGLIERAVKKYNIDLSKSYFIGDTFTDVLTGINAGVKTIKLPTAVVEKTAATPNYYCENLLEAVKIILNK